MAFDDWFIDGFLILFVECDVSWHHQLGITFDWFSIHSVMIGMKWPWPQFFWLVESFTSLLGELLSIVWNVSTRLLCLSRGFSYLSVLSRIKYNLYFFFNLSWLQPAFWVSYHFSFSSFLSSWSKVLNAYSFEGICGCANNHFNGKILTTTLLY